VANVESGISKAELEQASLFRRSLRRFLAESDRAARRAGLTPQRYLLLLAIKASRHGQCTIGDLAEQLQLAQSTVTELVDRAELAGLARRMGDSGDGRVVQVRLTPEGERRFREAYLAVRDERQTLIAHLRLPDPA
jgi:DNA-binding MarR family transcriptional regulator